MVCVESPEVWFDDVLTVPVSTRVQYIMIDPIFCETVEEGSIRVVSIVPDAPALFGAKVLPRQPEVHLAQIRLENLIPESSGTRPTTVTLSIRGIRRGCAGQRFRRFTDEQMKRNSAFWQSAYE